MIFKHQKVEPVCDRLSIINIYHRTFKIEENKMISLWIAYMADNTVRKIFNKSIIDLFKISTVSKIMLRENCIVKCRYKSAFSMNSLGLVKQFGVVYQDLLHSITMTS